MVGMPRLLLILVSGPLCMLRLGLVVGPDLSFGLGCRWRRRRLLFVLRSVGAELVH